MISYPALSQQRNKPKVEVMECQTVATNRDVSGTKQISAVNTDKSSPAHR